ncbi:hypothetical protein D1012_17225 [Pseudotabrizicola alkalilacus]|uniref:Uncharacterized protein n=1 Tax=Pseudotabrizicola alkalilacus TaxID=2305252 RepID=A0A411YZ99_9RHOB|nr:hypothetical protein D1012_17225 [Pseudotabrizicola alkalilacus]
MEIFPLESATSVASHLARQKGAPSLASWCTDVGIALSDLTAGQRVALARLAQLGEVDIGVLSHHAVIDKGRHGVLLLGHDMRGCALS